MGNLLQNNDSQIKSELYNEKKGIAPAEKEIITRHTVDALHIEQDQYNKQQHPHHTQADTMEKSMSNTVHTD